MRIGIIEAGVPPAALVAEHGTYDAMTRRFVGAHHVYETFRVFDGQLPAAGHGCGAFVVTGSAAGVKDGLPWVDALIAFLRETRGKAGLVGICFGHQVMAQAFGGDVAKAPQGWGLGLHRYDIRARAAWMDAASCVRGTASHQDQVLVPPPRCDVRGASDFTPYAILEYRDHPAMSVQFHPEFSSDFARALLETRRLRGVAPDQVAAASTSLAEDNDNARVAGWIDRFLSTRANDRHP